MNIFAIGGLGTLTAGLLYVFVDQTPAQVYDQSVPQVYQALTATDLGASTAPEWSSLQTKVSGNGTDTIFWTTQTSHSGRQCRINLAPFEGDDSKTHISINCKGGGAGDGAAAGMAHNMARDRMIERIDSLLTDREFDAARAGATAARWPGDGVDGSMGTAMKKSLEMNSEMNKMAAEMQEEAQRNRDAGGSADSDWGN